MSEALKKAKELIEQTNGVYKIALILVMHMIEEHSCYTLDDERWEFWVQVRNELKLLENEK